MQNSFEIVNKASIVEQSLQKYWNLYPKEKVAPQENDYNENEGQ